MSNQVEATSPKTHPQGRDGNGQTLRLVAWETTRNCDLSWLHCRASALQGIRLAKDAGIEFQINTTITRTNLHEISSIQDLAITLGAAAHHIFFLFLLFSFLL